MCAQALSVNVCLWKERKPGVAQPAVPPPGELPCIHGSAPNSAAIHTPLEKVKGTQMCPVTADALTSPLNQQGPPCSQGSDGT